MSGSSNKSCSAGMSRGGDRRMLYVMTPTITSSTTFWVTQKTSSFTLTTINHCTHSQQSRGEIRGVDIRDWQAA